MLMKRAVVLLTATAAVALGVGAAQAAQAASSGTHTHSAHHRTTSISFVAKRQTVHQVDVAPTGPSIGDETYIGGKIVKGNVRGYTSAQCVTVTTEDHNIAQCEVDLLLRHGTLLTIGTSTDRSAAVHLAVVGGTGKYAGASGTGTLRPTAAGSNVALRLH